MVAPYRASEIHKIRCFRAYETNIFDNIKLHNIVDIDKLHEIVLRLPPAVRNNGNMLLQYNLL